MNLILDLIMNLINRLYHECEKISIILCVSRVPKKWVYQNFKLFG